MRRAALERVARPPRFEEDPQPFQLQLAPALRLVAHPED
jgi:hypothetical protein